MRPDHGEGVLALRERPRSQGRANRPEGFRVHAEGLIPDHKLARNASLVAAETQDGVVVSLRQGQKQTVPAHQAERYGGFSESETLAALEAPNGLDLRLVQVAGSENLLLDWVSRRLDPGDLRLRLAIWIDVHRLKLSSIAAPGQRQPGCPEIGNPPPFR